MWQHQFVKIKGGIGTIWYNFNHNWEICTLCFYTGLHVGKDFATTNVLQIRCISTNEIFAYLCWYNYVFNHELRKMHIFISGCIRDHIIVVLQIYNEIFKQIISPHTHICNNAVPCIAKGKIQFTCSCKCQVSP